MIRSWHGALGWQARRRSIFFTDKRRYFSSMTLGLHSGEAESLAEPFGSTTIARYGCRRANSGPVAIWLLVTASMIMVMIVLGGMTRLTGSGLSIMEWAPFGGALPPLSKGEWNRLYGLYQQVPQYRLLHQGFGMAGFKQIFWLEWIHRLWGRLLGVVFLLPLIYFFFTRRIGGRLARRLGVLFVLGALQGGVGWFMVASGFEADTTSVSPYRLVLHLVLALALYVGVLSTALSLLHPARRRFWEPRYRTHRLLAACLLASVALTIVAGGFVSGLHAGLAYNSFPLMDGSLVPRSYMALKPLIRNLTENIASVQFDHRALATWTAVLGMVTVASCMNRQLPSFVRRAAVIVLVVLVAQYAFGVATLLTAVAVPLAALHQATAIGLLTAALVLFSTLCRGGEA